MKELTYDQALYKAAALCSSSEQCLRQMEEKLEKWGVQASDIEKILKHLIDEKYIDETRYARAFALDKFRYNRWGRHKIRQMLRMQHIEEHDINLAMEEIDEEEYTSALRHIMQQKARQIHETDSYQRRGKLIRYAVSKGFEMELAIEVAEDL